MDNISTLKEKILSFLAHLGIRKVDFFEATAIQPSNFKGANVKSAPGGDMLVKILTIYPQLSAEWLMRGEGDMIRNSDESQPSPANIQKESTEVDIPMPAFSELLTTVRVQAEEIGRLKARIEQLERREVKKTPVTYADTPEFAPSLVADSDAP